MLICDPPRAGLGAPACDVIVSARPRRIVYVSCDPSTFSRDCGVFTLAAYRLSALALIDMFPGTFHIETIAVLDAD